MALNIKISRLVVAVFLLAVIGAGAYWLRQPAPTTQSQEPDTSAEAQEDRSEETPSVTNQVDSEPINDRPPTVAPAAPAEESVVLHNPKIAPQGSVITTSNPEEVEEYAKVNNLTVTATHTVSDNKTLVTLAESSLDPRVQNIETAVFGSKAAANHTYKATFTPNDTNYSAQWNLAKISAPAAWDISRGSADVTIAVIDTGVLFEQAWGTHGPFTQPDFPATKRWENPAEQGLTVTEGPAPNCTSRDLTLDKACNNLDDDGNGQIDDWQGWDFMGGYNGGTDCPNYRSDVAASTFYSQDNDPNPYSCDSTSKPTELNKTQYNGSCTFGESACFIGHGTIVGSVAAAASNNSQLVAGVDHNALVMNLRVLDGYGYTTTARVAAAVEYATNNGADVINMSLAVSDCSSDFVDPTLEAAMETAKTANIIVVAASGNENESNVCYPASSGNAIAVGASDQNDKRASFSNYGSKLDILAPGVGIPAATAPSKSNNNVLYHSSTNGTSLATPHVAGLAGLIKSLNPDINFDGIYELIAHYADRPSVMGSFVRTAEHGFGRLNLHTSIAVANGEVPVHRLYHSGQRDHFYTTSLTERNSAISKHKYRDEGIGFWVLPQASDSIPVYRLYKMSVGDHFYTTNSTERVQAINIHGYRDEGIGFWVLPQASDSIPVYRLYHGGVRDHFYTTNLTERNTAISKYKYRDEGIGFEVP